jgi:uncharacterized damage-inducible protein DinB
MIATTSTSSAIAPLSALLHHLFDVVMRLSDAQYTQKPVGVIESSVGGHVRHCLDHVRAVLDAIDTGELNYDVRQRGTAVESSVRGAADQIDQLMCELELLDDDVLSRTIVLATLLAPDDPPICVNTSVGRELAYVLAHTVHHNALVGAMVKTLGGWLPERFGYAPSTIKNLERNVACVR